MLINLKTKWLLSGKMKETNARDRIQLKMKRTCYFTVTYMTYMIMGKTLIVLKQHEIHLQITTNMFKSVFFSTILIRISAG